MKLHSIDAVLPTMGGQTALNLCIEADEKGIWDDFDVKIIGVGPGFSFSYDGPTHHGTQDLYLMYLIPEFEIINISFDILRPRKFR